MSSSRSPGVAAVFDSYSPDVPQYKPVGSQGLGKGLGLKSEVIKKEAKARVQPHGSFKAVGDKSKWQSVDDRCNRTVFLGNIPAICTKKHIKQLFKPYGSIQTIRFRSIKVAQGDLSIRHAKMTGKQIVEGSSFNAYIVLSSQSEAENSLTLNGTLFHGRHLRVDMLAGTKEEADSNRSVFVGNLPFSADEEKLREVFSICGEIEGVRIVRDRKSGMGKGFGFIAFVDSSGVMFAVKQHKKAVLDGRTLRVCRSKNQQALQQEKQAKLSGTRYSAVKLKVGAGKVGRNLSKNFDEKKRKAVHRGKHPPLRSKIGKRRADGTKNRHRRLAAIP